jgi:prepilin-type N-terminal cleavage/methylation domain-containing protein/prepilin-type processing-associated H-X9-DG protein
MQRKPIKAFTLIELLVVIAIIALLLSILLPSLKNAKALAKRVVCGTSIKGLAQAVQTYASEWDGRIVPWEIADDFENDLYPQREFWANMLVRGKTVSAPNGADTPAKDDQSQFRCPECNDKIVTNWLGPTESHRTEQAFRWLTLTRSSADQDPNTDPAPVEVNGLFVRSWYSMNAGNQPYIPSRWRLHNNGQWHRTARLKKTSELVMMTEGACPNQFYRPPRIPGRHPPVSKNGRNGYANLAFWDGHVKVYDTERFDNTITQYPYLTWPHETIFYLDKEYGTWDQSY